MNESCFDEEHKFIQELAEMISRFEDGMLEKHPDYELPDGLDSLLANLSYMDDAYRRKNETN